MCGCVIPYFVFTAFCQGELQKLTIRKGEERGGGGTRFEGRRREKQRGKAVPGEGVKLQVTVGRRGVITGVLKVVRIFRKKEGETADRVFVQCAVE